MRIVTGFPHAVREIENAFIPLSDGCRLAARLWLPETAETAPVPAVLEYLPYRKRMGTRWRDEPIHRYFAGHGYASVRVDIRGSGESDGVLVDEYTEQEQRDGVEALAWIAAQAWCNGSVGMIGKSWGGFGALQIAARRPPSLRAAVVVCAADDRYADDAHYMGGCLLTENFIWGAALLTLAAQPPDPALVGPRWREMWEERLAAAPLYPALWLRHPRRDDYWKQGSVCEDYGAIRCPVFLAGGWADGYTNAIPRLLEKLRVPRKGLIGPWAHLYPHEGRPQPAIGFLQEVLGWWDRWLREGTKEPDAEPVLRAYLQEPPMARAFEDFQPGRWIAEETWPSPRIAARRYWFGRGTLEPAGRARRGPEPPLWVSAPQTVGLRAGSWSGSGPDAELAQDQADDDAGSLLFDSPPLPADLEILGACRVRIAFSSDQPCAILAVRLCDVDERGNSTRVSYGLSNLAHGTGGSRPAPLVPGRRYETEVRLNDAAHRFARGHRLRIALSTAYWPVAWPSPAPVRLAIHPHACGAEIPVRSRRPGEESPPPFPEPEAASPLAATDLHPGGVRRTVRFDPETGESVHETAIDYDEEGRPALSRIEAIDLEVGHALRERFFIRRDDPLSARLEIENETIARREGWSTRVWTRLRCSASREAFRIEGELLAYDGESCVSDRRWDESIPRDLV